MARMNKAQAIELMYAAQADCKTARSDVQGQLGIDTRKACNKDWCAANRIVRKYEDDTVTVKQINEAIALFNAVQNVCETAQAEYETAQCNVLRTPQGHKVTKQEIDDILCNCFEGASTYWADKINPSSYPNGANWGSDVISRGATIDIAHQGELVDTLTLEKFLVGLDMFLAAYPEFVPQADETDLENLIVNGVNDNLLQFALFGEIVYG